MKDLVQIKFHGGEEILAEMISSTVAKNPLIMIKFAMGNSIAYTLRPWLSLQEVDDEVYIFRAGIAGSRTVKSEKIISSYQKFLKQMEEEWKYTEITDQEDLTMADSDELIDYLESLEPSGSMN